MMLLIEESIVITVGKVIEFMFLSLCLYRRAS